MTIHKIKKNTIFFREKQGRKYIYHVMTPKGKRKILYRTDFRYPLQWQEFDSSLKYNILSINDAAYILLNLRS
mgnify:CR=1 FL=1|jgi:hypothetical protein